jgi:hypothetical protein
MQFVGGANEKSRKIHSNNDERKKGSAARLHPVLMTATGSKKDHSAGAPKWLHFMRN